MAPKFTTPGGYTGSQAIQGSTPTRGTDTPLPSTPSMPNTPQLDVTGPLPSQGQSGLDGAAALLANKLHPLKR